MTTGGRPNRANRSADAIICVLNLQPEAVKDSDASASTIKQRDML